jgi:hypothetical protein
MSTAELAPPGTATPGHLDADPVRCPASRSIGWRR